MSPYAITFFTPGMVLREDYGITRANLSFYANLIGITEDHLNDLLNDDVRITRRLSKKLTTALGIQSEDYFIWLQKQALIWENSVRKSVKKTYERRYGQ